MVFPQTVDIEIIGPVNIYLGFLLQVVMAFFLGGLIGLDREKKLKAAGIKTNVLICLGATIYTSVSLLNDGGGQTAYDPNRIAAQIVSGIGFLGAGAILRGPGGGISGLTTAATIWVVAAIGVTIGLGHIFIASIFTVGILLALTLINPLYKLMSIKREFTIKILSKKSIKSTLQGILLTLLDSMPKIEEVTLDEKTSKCFTQFYLETDSKQLHKILRHIEDLKDVIEVKHDEVDSH